MGDGATVAAGVGDAVAGLVTTGSVDGTVDGAEVAVETDVEAIDVEVTVELLDDDELAVSVEDVGDVALDEVDVVVGSEDEVDALVDVADVSVEVAVVDDEVVVDEVDDVLDDVLDDDVVSTTGTGNRVSGEDGRTGSGSPGGGKVAAGFCSTTL